MILAGERLAYLFLADILMKNGTLVFIARIFHIFLLYFPALFFLGKLGFVPAGTTATVAAAVIAVVLGEVFFNFFKSLGRQK